MERPILLFVACFSIGCAINCAPLIDDLRLRDITFQRSNDISEYLSPQTTLSRIGFGQTTINKPLGTCNNSRPSEEDCRPFYDKVWTMEKHLDALSSELNKKYNVSVHLRDQLDYDTFPDESYTLRFFASNPCEDGI